MAEYMILIICFVIAILIVLFLSQKGGGFIEFEAQSALPAIDKILYGTYNYSALVDFMKQNIHEEEPCLPRGTLVKYNRDLLKGCSYPSKDIIDYKFRYKLRDLLTTIYVRAFKENLGKRYPLEILKYFNQGIQEFCARYNAANEEHIEAHIIFKGGNVINIYHKMLLLALNLPTGKEYIKKKEKLLKKTWPEFKRGDWDYSLYIHDVSDRANEQARTFVLYMMQQIKSNIDKFGIFNYNNIANNIKKVFRTDIKQIVDEYVSEKGEKTSIRSIQIPDYKITEESISLANSVPIFSKAVIPRNGITDFFQLDSFMESNDVDKMQTSPVSIGHISNLSMLNGDFVSNFDLARLKINNIVELPNENLNLSADIIDMSFINKTDTKSALNERRAIAVRSTTYTMRRVGDTLLPMLTPEYLYYDLYFMLIDQQPFLWQNKKYEKRIDRLIIMSIICSLRNSGFDSTIKTLKSVIDILSQLTGDLDRDIQIIRKEISLSNLVSDLYLYGEVKLNKKDDVFISTLVKYVYMILMINAEITGKDLLDNERNFVEGCLRSIKNRRTDLKNDLPTYDQLKAEGVDVEEYKKYIRITKEKLEEYQNLFGKVKKGEEINFNEIFDGMVL